MDADRLLLENKIMNIKERVWFFDPDDSPDWVDIEGTMTSTFLHLEDVKFSPFLDKLWIDGQVSSDLSSILDKTHSFYSSLYAKQDLKTDQEIVAFLDNLTDLPIVIGDTSLMTAEITVSEIEQAIKQLKTGKAPGCDGLTASFYKHFVEHLAPMLCEVFNYAYKNKTLSISQYLVIIILLFKRGDQLSLNNYRPISLTNADYKILAYVLTAHLSEHLKFLISPQQTAYMKGCFIGTNIRSVQDMIDHTVENNLDHAVLFLDFKKAFDSVSHLFLHKLLVCIGIPAQFVDWIHIIYSDAKSVVRYKNLLLASFPLGQGVRQGYPLSCHLFNLVGQVLIYSL